MSDKESKMNDIDMSPEGMSSLKKKEAFLKSKINFQPDEKFSKSYVCGLADKFILSGRLYITNKRLCFFSKFNPKNVFFGETFIEIPK
jgi:hypothetical protein